MQSVTIEKMVFGGQGLARTDSGVVFVENGLPGEIVEIVPETRKHDCQVGRIVNILKASDLRREPPCSFAGICGGCDWLFIRYPGQLQFKRDIFIDCLKRIGKLESFPEPEVYESPEFGYRIRAQIKVDQSGKCGFFRKKSHDVVQIGKCPLLCDNINGLLKVFSEKSAILPPGSLRVVAGDSSITSDPLISGLTEVSTEISVSQKKFKISGGSFFQSNRYLLNKLGTWALPDIQGDTCIDLYGGIGFFSIMLSEKIKKGILVESFAEQVQMARQNYFLNGIEHFSAVKSQVEHIRGVVKWKPDLLIIDPPRPGLTRIAREEIVNIDARQILYISCNCSTQARDLGYLVNKCGYSIKRMAVFDLYPNTVHLETAVILCKE